MIRAVAWDVDGTLVDSEPTHHTALMRASALHGVHIERYDARFVGVAMDEVWEILHPLYPAALTREDWIAAIVEAYVGAVEGLAPLPGAVEAVAALARAGVVQACVSNSTRRIVEANLAALGLTDAFAVKICRDDVARGKPDPEPYALACRRLGLAPAEVVAIEDSDVGAASAEAAGLKVLRVDAGGEAFAAVAAMFG